MRTSFLGTCRLLFTADKLLAVIARIDCYSIFPSISLTRWRSTKDSVVISWLTWESRLSTSGFCWVQPFSKWTSLHLLAWPCDNRWHTSIFLWTQVVKLHATMFHCWTGRLKRLCQKTSPKRCKALVKIHCHTAASQLCPHMPTILDSYSY